MSSTENISAIRDESSTLSEATFTSTLQRITRTIFEAGDFESLTLKRVRADAEQTLGLETDFFKSHEQWKDKSKNIVNETVSQLEAAQDTGPEERASEADESPKTVIQKPAKSELKKLELKDKNLPQKRKSQDLGKEHPTKKRHKHDDESSSQLSSTYSSAENDQIEERKHNSEPKSSTSNSAPEPQSLASGKQGDDIDDSSELSDVVDEPPLTKKSARKGAGNREKLSNNGKQKKQPKKDSPISGKASSPQEEEIKKLQSQLVKCGLRKVWGRELAKCDSSGEKISHLKSLLRDVGMQGRFSEEKARQIKERRELDAELEAVQEYSKAWGKERNSGDNDGEEVTSKEANERPARKRVLARGLQELQDLADDDEESD